MPISFSPSQTVTPPSGFSVQTGGYIQGVQLDDPTERQHFLSGLIGSGVAQPLWGGIAITESLASPGSNGAGNTLTLATAAGNVSGFSVIGRVHSTILTPGNTVPVAYPGMTIGYFRIGSQIRIPVLCSSALLSAAEGNPTNTQVEWDFTNQQLIPFASGGTALDVTVVELSANGKVVSYDSTTGLATWTDGPVAVIQL